MAHRLRPAGSRAAPGRGDDLRGLLRPGAAQPASELITGSVCGVKVQEVEDPLMRRIRYLDKLVDELAKGKAMDKVLRSA